MFFNQLYFALYDLGTPVTMLNANSFDKVVKKSPVPVMTEFFAPWCGHCKNLKPIYEAVARKSKCIKMAAIDCDEHKGTCGQYGVEGFPTLKLWKTVYKNGKKKRFSVDYKGERTEKAIGEFITSSLSDIIKRVYVKEKPTLIEDKQWLLNDLESFYDNKNATLTKAIVVNKDCKVSTTLKCLSLEFYKKIEFAVSCDPIIIKDFGEGFIIIPSDQVVKKKDLKSTKYDGTMKEYDAVRKFLVPYKSKSVKKVDKDEL